jgi:hypothetical protein
MNMYIHVCSPQSKPMEKKKEKKKWKYYPDFRLNLAIWLVDIVLINFSAMFY